MSLSLLYLGNLLAGILIGGVLFTSLLTAPIVFVVLDQSTATRFTRKLWPRYFVTCAILGGCLSAIVFARFGVGLTFGLSLGFTSLMVLDFGVARWIKSLRGDELDADMEGTVKTLHRLSVWINYTCLVLIGLSHYLLVTSA